MSFFISTLQTTVYSNIRDMQKYLLEKQKGQPAQLYVIWEFCYKTMSLHLWTNVWEKDINEYKNKDCFDK